MICYINGVKMTNVNNTIHPNDDLLFFKESGESEYSKITFYNNNIELGNFEILIEDEEPNLIQDDRSNYSSYFIMPSFALPLSNENNSGSINLIIRPTNKATGIEVINQDIIFSYIPPLIIDSNFTIHTEINKAKIKLIDIENYVVISGKLSSNVPHCKVYINNKYSNINITNKPLKIDEGENWYFSDVIYDAKNKYDAEFTFYGVANQTYIQKVPLLFSNVAFHLAGEVEGNNYGGVLIGESITEKLSEPSFRCSYPAFFNDYKFGYDSGDEIELSLNQLAVPGFFSNGSTVFKGTMYLGQPIFSEKVIFENTDNYGFFILRCSGKYVENYKWGNGKKYDPSIHKIEILNAKAGILMIEINNGSKFKDESGNTVVNNTPGILTFGDKIAVNNNAILKIKFI